MNERGVSQFFSKYFENIVPVGGGGSSDIARGISKIDFQNMEKGTKVAIKTPKTFNPNTRERFEHEAFLLNQFNNSEYIIKFYAFVESDNRKKIAIVEELGDDNLYDWKETEYENGMPEGLIDRYAERMCLAVDLVHSTKDENGLYILHRDIKPHNFLIVDGGILKLGDLGSAGNYTTNPNRGKIGASSRGMHGSVYFMAPELLIEGDATRWYGPHTDVYSIAATLIHLYIPELPWESLDAENINAIRDAKSNSSTITKLKKSLSDVISSENKVDALIRSIDPDPDTRIQTTKELLDVFHGKTLATYLEKSYTNLEDLLNKSYNSRLNVTQLANVDAIIHLHQNMIKYVHNHNTTSTLVDDANNLIITRAENDHDALLGTVNKITKYNSANNYALTMEKHGATLKEIYRYLYYWGNDYVEGGFISKNESRNTDKKQIDAKFNELINKKDK